MRSRTWFLVFCAAFVLAGCDEGGTTIIGGEQYTGNFPGTLINQYFVSDDGRALNHSNAKINKGLQVFWNASNGHAIVLYLDGAEKLWAHHWDGTRFTPPVELRGPGQRDVSADEADERGDYGDADEEFYSFEHYRVLFLNTNTGGRNGDAIILFVREDDPNPAIPLEGTNHRLYGTYFDVSESGNPTSAGDTTVHYGFESMGTVIDFNNGNDDVDDFGFVSDSLRYSHGYEERDRESNEWPNRFDEGSENALTPATQSGDPTSFVWFVWRKNLEDLTGAGIANRYHALEFNLAQVGNAIPSQASLGAGVIPPVAGSTIADIEGVEHSFVVHNGCMIWRATVSIGETGVFLTCFDATGFDTIELSQSVNEGILAGAFWAGTNPQLPLPGNVYGGDHGLTNLYAFFSTDEFPGHIVATKVDLTVTFDQAAREISAIENPSGAPIEEFRGRKGDYAPETRINRTGSWIFVAWLQSTLVPLTEQQLAGLSTGTRQVHMHGVQTGARTLANSLVTGGPFLAPNQVGPVSNESGRLFIQEEIADGTQDPRCGIQSNLNRINLLWHEGTTPVIDLKHNGLTIVPSTSATTPPTGGPSVVTGGLVTMIFDSTSGESHEFDSTVSVLVTDLGTADGSPLIYFVNNDNNPLDPNAVGAFDELRVYGHPGVPGATPAANELVSTDGLLADNSLNEEITDPNNNNGTNGIDDYTEQGGHFLRGRTTPTSTAATAHGGTRFHLFWVEARHGEFSQPALRTRYFTKSAFNPATLSGGAGTFGAAHTPALGSDPRGLGGPNNDEEFLPPTVHPSSNNADDIGPFSAFATSTANTVGIYFTTTGHFWYQEFNGTSWLPAPELIDNESGANLFMGRDQRAYTFPPMRIGTCDNMNGAIVTYAKPPPGDDPGHRRQFVRVRD